MWKTSHVMLVCVVVAAVALTWGGGKKTEKQTDKSWTVDGGDLRIVTPCAKTVSIEPSADLTGKVEVSATGRRGEIDQLDVAGGATASMGAHDGKCKGGGPHFSFSLFRLGVDTGPSLAITVKVPAGTAIDIREGKSTDYDIGAVGGVLTLDLSGSGDVSAAEVKDPVVRLSGSGDAQLDKVSGTLDGRLTGSGDLSIGRADVSNANLASSSSGDLSVDEGDFAALAVRLTGSGDLSVGEGKVGSLTVASSGSGGAQVDAVVGDADLSASGSGDIEVHEVTGQCKQAHHGSGSIKIGDR